MTVPGQDHSTTTDAEIIAMLRKRIHDLEEAAENYIVVMNATGEQRMKAMEPLVKAMTVTFKDAILSSHDMTDEQRDHWLAEIAKEDPKAAEAQS